MLRVIKKMIFIGYFILIPSSLWAMVISKPGATHSFKGDHHAFFLGFDAYARSLLKTTSSDSGKKDFISTLQFFPITFGYNYHLDPDSYLTTQIDYSFFPKRGPDGATEESHLLIRVPYVQRIGHSDFYWKAGLLYHQMRIAGQGGTASMNNGTGTTSFGLPNESRTTDTIAHEVGFNYEYKAIVVQNSLIIEAPLNSYHRTFSFMLGLVFNLGGF